MSSSSSETTRTSLRSMPMAVRYSAMKPMFLSLVRPDRISSPMTSRAAVTTVLPGFVSDISQLSRRQGLVFCFRHDLFRKPAATPDQVRGRLFRDHALTCRPKPLKRREPVRPHSRHDH